MIVKEVYKAVLDFRGDLIGVEMESLIIARQFMCWQVNRQLNFKN
jgi:hypothetical protein